MGIIPTSSVRRFIERPRDDFRFFKRLSNKELERRARRLPIMPPLWADMTRDQRICFLIGAKTGRFCFWADTGTGKSLISISLFLYFRQLGYVQRCLVLVPNKINKAEWQREVRKWARRYSVESKTKLARALVLEGSTAEKWEAFENSSRPFVIETYGGFVRMMTSTEENQKTGKRRLKLSGRMLSRMARQCQSYVFDESIMIIAKKRRGSLTHRAAYHLSRNGEIAFALNGTPHGRDPIDLWGQMRVIDLGESLGETLGLFRAAFYTEEVNPFWGGVTYRFKRNMKAVLNRMIAHRSIRIEAKESDLPRVVYRKKVVTLSEDAEVIYAKARDQLIAAHGNIREMNNAFLRMRQISSGFVGYHDDEAGAKARYEFPSKPKLEMLSSLLQEVSGVHKSIVFHDFVFSGDLIEAELKKLKIGYVRQRGHKGNALELLERFDKDKKTRVFVLNNYEGSGLNLQTASYGFYYESPVRNITRKQTRRRFERQFSPHKRIWLYDLVCKGTADERILALHKQGADIYEAVVNGRF